MSQDCKKGKPNLPKGKIRKCITFRQKQWTIITTDTHDGDCDCPTAVECKKRIEDCAFDKNTCHKRREKREGKKRTHWGGATVIIGILLLFIFCILMPEDIPQLPLWINIINGILVSIIATGLFTIVIDMPSRRRADRQNLIDTITDHRYLKELDERDLSTLRKKVTYELHTKNTPNAAEELIQIDEKICKLLKRPYYEYYEYIVVCDTYAKNDAYREKHITIRYKLVNPCGKHRPAWEHVGFQLLVFKDDTTVSKPVDDLVIKCSVDGQGYIDYSNDVNPYTRALDKKTDFYNHRVTVIKNGSTENSDRTKNGPKVDYNNYIQVEISYTLIAPKDDNCFTKCMRYPTKALSIDYTDRSPNIELLGRMIGTELEYPAGRMTYKKQGDKSSLMVNSHDKWLLPNEGVLIVTSPKKEM